MLLSEVWQQYKLDKQLEGYSPYTLKSYELQSNLFIRYVGDIPIKDVTFEMMKDYLREQAGRLKPSSIANRMKYFKSVWKWAHTEGYIESNPAYKLKEPKMGKRIPKAMSEEAIEHLRVACKTPLEHAILETFFATGCRAGEVHSLNRNSINWEHRSIIVRGKGDKEREVYFTIQCGIWLKKYLKSRTDNDIALFVTERKYKSNGNQPRRMTTDQFRWVIKRIARNAGIDDVYPHKLRHSYATHLLNNEAPLEVIQQFLGHASLDTTRIYSDYNTEMKKQLYRKYF